MTFIARTLRCIAPVFGATLSLVFVTPPVLAQDAAQAEKAQIEAERNAAEERYRARERECRERFVVTSCVEDAQRQRRATLDALRARQLKLDEARRRARAAERRAEIAEKMAEDAKRANAGQERAERSQAAPREPRKAREPREARERREPRPPRPTGEGLPSSASGSKSRPRSADDPAERRAREERSRAAFEARQRKAAEHRASSIEQSIKRMHEREAAAPLPVPSASAIRGTRGASGP